MKRFTVIVLTLAFVLAACSPQTSARRNDEKLSGQILEDLQRAHPVPQFRRSQLRQNLVELTTAQAETTQTTSFFFNMGIQDPVNQCPSIGFPIPATMQLTNPDIPVGGSGGRVTVQQVEPTGVYTGDTTGTYVICIDARGSAYAVYWEGFVQTVTGPAEYKNGRVELVGPPSFNFTNETADATIPESETDE